jgi:hypothetical protein
MGPALPRTMFSVRQRLRLELRSLCLSSNETPSRATLDSRIRFDLKACFAHLNRKSNP